MFTNRTKNGSRRKRLGSWTPSWLKCVLRWSNGVCSNRRLAFMLISTERDHKKTGQPQTTQQPFPRDGEVLTGENRSCPYRHGVNQVAYAIADTDSDHPVCSSGLFLSFWVWLFVSLLCFLFLFYSALIKQVNKSIEGTADDDDEGVPTEQAIRAGLELLKVSLGYVPHDGVVENYFTSS